MSIYLVFFVSLFTGGLVLLDGSQSQHSGRDRPGGARSRGSPLWPREAMAAVGAPHLCQRWLWWRRWAFFILLFLLDSIEVNEQKRSLIFCDFQHGAPPSSAAIKFTGRKQMAPMVFYGSPQGVPAKKPLSLLRLLREIRIDLKKETESIPRCVILSLSMCGVAKSRPHNAHFVPIHCFLLDM